MAIPKWLSGFVFHVTRSAATALVFAAAMALWASVRIYAAAIQLGLPFALVGGFLVFVAMVVAWNQLQQIDERNQRRRLAHRSSADIEKQIWDWLKKNNFAIQNEPDPKLAEFRLVANNRVGVGVTIFREPNSPWVTVATRMDISPDHRPIVKRDAPLFKWDMGIALLQMGSVQYEMIEDGSEISAVVVSQPVIFDESIDELTFLQTMMLVRRGAMLTSGVVNKIVERSKLPKAQQSLPASTHDR